MPSQGKSCRQCSSISLDCRDAHQSLRSAVQDTNQNIATVHTVVSEACCDIMLKERLSKVWQDLEVLIA